MNQKKIFVYILFSMVAFLFAGCTLAPAEKKNSSSPAGPYLDQTFDSAASTNSWQVNEPGNNPKSSVSISGGKLVLQGGYDTTGPYSASANMVKGVSPSGNFTLTIDFAFEDASKCNISVQLARIAGGSIIASLSYSALGPLMLLANSANQPGMKTVLYNIDISHNYQLVLSRTGDLFEMTIKDLTGGSSSSKIGITESGFDKFDLFQLNGGYCAAPGGTGTQTFVSKVYMSQ